MSKNVENLNGTPTPDTREIRYCEGHWRQLQIALLDRDLLSDLPDPDINPLTEASMTITTTALSLFGAEALFSEKNKGCPVCAFNNVIEYMADTLARRYKLQ